MFNNFLTKILNKIYFLTSRFFYIIRRPKVLYYIEKLDSIDVQSERVSYAKKVCKKFPDHPLPYIKYAHALYDYGGVELFNVLSQYDKVNNLWLKENKKKNKNLSFIPLCRFIGSLGAHYPLREYIKLHHFLEEDKNKPIMLLSNRFKLRNSYYSSYFKPYLSIISNEYLIFKYQILSKIYNIPLEFALPIDGKCLPWDIQTNIINQRILAKDGKFKFFNFNKNDIEKGKKILSKLGLSKDCWYVTLHVRQPGYRDAYTETEDYRNADPLTYIKAIKSITSIGGKVILVGDSSMKIMSKIHGLIDYAHSNEKSEFMDVFLSATCKFFIGTSSGPYDIAMTFGKPVLLTNFLPATSYWTLTDHDMFLSKVLIDRKNNKKLTLKEMFSFPICYYGGGYLKDNDIDYIDNSDEELENATQEMIDRIIYKSNNNNNHYNDKFKKIIESTAKSNGDQKLKAFANMSTSFLEKNSFLLND